jgi:hypothetical protein
MGRSGRRWDKNTWQLFDIRGEGIAIRENARDGTPIIFLPQQAHILRKCLV